MNTQTTTCPMTLPMQLTIYRPSFGDGRKVMVIDVTDEVSGTQFLTLEMPLEALMEALAGLAVRPCTGKIRRLDRLGLVRVSEERSVVCPLKTHNREELRSWLIANCQEEGWELDPFLGSQNSIKYGPDEERTLNYSVFKYVARKEEA